MATFRNRTGKWQARIRRQGHKDITKSFITLQDAEKWARQTEVELDKNTYCNTTLAEKTTFKELIERYIGEVTPTMRSASEDSIRLRAISRRPISQTNMLALTPSKIAAYRDERLKEVSPGTVIRELCYFSSIINHARREWDINIENPVKLVRKPASPKGRDRILTLAEKKLILDFFKTVKINHFSIWMPCIIEFALETAMRLSEITTLTWKNVDFNKRTAFLELTKNGESRYVPLSTKAISLLNSIPRSIDGRVFPVKPTSVSMMFTKRARAAGVDGVRFHDLRHTAITNFFEKGLNMIEVSTISGHKTLQMLKRYTHLKAEDLAKKLG